MKRIESAANETFRELLALAGSARERRRLGLSVIEGVHLLEAYLVRSGAPRQIFLPARIAEAVAAAGRDMADHGAERAARAGAADPAQAGAASAVAEIAALLQAAGLEPVVLADRLFAQASQVEHGPGPIALVDTPRPTLPDRLVDDAVYLDRVQDPGNVGTVLRTCAAVGVRRVITSPGTAFCWSPKVLRAAMGAHFHLDIHEGVPPSELLARLAVEAVATTADAPAGLWQADLRGPRVWLLGNEGQGLEAALLAAPGVRRVSIPQSEAVESLNVGVAAAVCLYEQLRQRVARTPVRTAQ
jgi:TrmH family RNA methyltransferase